MSTEGCGVEVATLRSDWTVIDRAEPETESGAPVALRTLWEDAESVETRPEFGVVYVSGKLTQVFTRKQEIHAAVLFARQREEIEAAVQE